MPMPPQINEYLNQPAYRVPSHPAPIHLALHANERPWDHASSFLQDAVDHLSEITHTVGTYPAPYQLESIYADYLGVDKDQVLLTAGGDEGLSRIFRAFLNVDTHVILPVPTFPMLSRFARWCQAQVLEIEWTQGAYPVQQVLDQVNEHTRLVLVVSPNNPTGLTITRQEFTTLASSLAEIAPQCLLVFDAAYIEFAHEDLSVCVLHYKNCILVRTLSKAFGLAGLRIGFLVADAHLIEGMRAVGLPYPVSDPGIRVASAVLKHIQNQPEVLQQVIEQVRKERTWLETFFYDLNDGSTVSESQGNFIWVNHCRALWWRDALAAQGIAIRIWPTDPQLKNAMRISCPAQQQDFEYLQKAIRNSVTPHAILFDVDGVLVDVSQSYRSAIIQTAAYFGVQIDEQEIQVWKSKGNANNDWVLTHTIVSAHGVEVDFEEIKHKFEMLYQNELWKKETVLAGSIEEVRQDLQKLSQYFPLALVTGRPQQDLQRFLTHFELGSFFTASVCMEDADAKPSPAPIKLAMQRLSQSLGYEVRSAWMIGDTPDDVMAAQRCRLDFGYSLLPLAIKTSHPPTVDSLWQAGCARMIDSWRDCLDLLSLTTEQIQMERNTHVSR